MPDLAPGGKHDHWTAYSSTGVIDIHSTASTDMFNAESTASGSTTANRSIGRSRHSKAKSDADCWNNMGHVAVKAAHEGATIHTEGSAPAAWRRPVWPQST